MAERMDLVTPRVGRDKTYWTKIGVAWKSQNGDGWRLVFEALPLPSKNRDGDWETTVIMRAPFDKDAQRAAQTFTSVAHPSEMEEIPF
jgi:hypothetical protein